MSGAAQAGFQGFSSSADPFSATTFLINQLLANIRTASLVQVISCSNSGAVAAVGTVSVQPMVNQVDGSGNATPHGTIYQIPYFRLQSGTNAIIIDPQPGDLGLMVVCDRDTSSAKANKGQANPGSRRRNDMADSFYFGGHLNGTPSNYVQFVNGAINVVATSSVTVTAPMATINASAGATINANTTIVGNLDVTGLVVGGYGTGDQVGLLSHKHPTAEPGAPSSPTAGT